LKPHTHNVPSERTPTDKYASDANDFHRAVGIVLGETVGTFITPPCEPNPAPDTSAYAFEPHTNSAPSFRNIAIRFPNDPYTALNPAASGKATLFAKTVTRAVPDSTDSVSERTVTEYRAASVNFATETTYAEAVAPGIATPSFFH
jgi:hypothetical protein